MVMALYLEAGSALWLGTELGRERLVFGGRIWTHQGFSRRDVYLPREEGLC
jgi:hypothetical protein